MFKKLFIMSFVIPLLYSGIIQNPVKKNMESSEFHSQTSTAFSLIGADPAAINNFGSFKDRC